MSIGRTVTIAGALALSWACSSESVPVSGAKVEMQISALNLEGADEVCYDLRVFNGTDTVWSAGDPSLTLLGADQTAAPGAPGSANGDADTVCSGTFGNGPGGDVSYVGTCDATSDTSALPGVQNDVTLWVDGLYAAGADLADWQDPCPTGCTLSFDCRENQDTLVPIDLTIMRRARQGFFDVAVEFEDLFCSAKLDCVPELLHTPEGQRGLTAVLGLACASGAGTATCLYGEMLELDCGDFGSWVVDPLAGPGNVPEDSPFLFAAAVYRGDEAFLDLDKSYWNVALGLDATLFDVGATCTLRWGATASQGGLADDTTPDHHVYPWIGWERDIVVAGQLACSRHQLDEIAPGESMASVRTRYTALGQPRYFARGYCHETPGGCDLPPPGECPSDVPELGAPIAPTPEAATLQPGAVLLFPRVVFGPDADTRIELINVSNFHQVLRMYLVSSGGDALYSELALTPRQPHMVIPEDHGWDPNDPFEGQLIVFVSDQDGCPTAANAILGSATVIDGITGSYPALAVPALSPDPGDCSALAFDGVQYARLPRALALAPLTLPLADGGRLALTYPAADLRQDSPPRPLGALAGELLGEGLTTSAWSTPPIAAPSALLLLGALFPPLAPDLLTQLAQHPGWLRLWTDHALAGHAWHDAQVAVDGVPHAVTGWRPLLRLSLSDASDTLDFDSVAAPLTLSPYDAGTVPGLPLASNVAPSDDRAGSALVFPYVTAEDGSETEIAVSNLSLTGGVWIALYYFKADGGEPVGWLTWLPAGATLRRTASRLLPRQSGWLLALAVDSDGWPLRYNGLAGVALIHTAEGLGAALAPLAIQALHTRPAGCQPGADDVFLAFDGEHFGQLPRVVASNVVRAVDDPAILVIDRIGGSTVQALSWNEFEQRFSNSTHVTGHQQVLPVRSLAVDLPPPDEAQPGQGVWLQLSAVGGAIFGALLTLDASASARDIQNLNVLSLAAVGLEVPRLGAHRFVEDTACDGICDAFDESPSLDCP